MAPALTLKVTDVAPCGTVTLEGTLATLGLELERETVTPPTPAVAVSLTVPVPDRPLRMTLGLTEMLLNAAGVAADGGLTVTPNVAVTPE
jgi:hypothetical protein